MLLQAALLLLHLPQSVLAAFTHSDQICWRRNCILRTEVGTFCFESHVDSGIEHEECADNFLKNLTRIHLTCTVGQSILY